MYVCENCGENFRHYGDGECYCGGQLEEGVRCAICGETWVISSECSVCRDCCKEYMNIENAIGLSNYQGYTRTIEIPECFDFLSENEIVEILKAHVLSQPNKEQDNIERHCTHYIGEFGDYLVEKFEKGEL